MRETTPAVNISGIVQDSICPVYREADQRTELINQLLFGEQVTLLHRQKNWVQVQSMADGYQGWVPHHHIAEVSESYLAPDQDAVYVTETLAPLYVGSGDNARLMWVPRGTRIPVFPAQKPDRLTLEIADQPYSIYRHCVAPPQPLATEPLLATANLYLNTPYLWGGKSPFGIDCSGFSQMVYRMHGLELPRDSYQQAERGEPVSFDQRRAGDLAFFESNDKITHVGILLSPQQIIHSSGRVRIDFLTDEGIYNRNIKTLTHRIHSIRRMLPASQRP